MDKLIYVGYDVQHIQNKEYLCIYILDIDKKVVLRIYKLSSPDILLNLNSLNVFEEVTNLCSYAIKRDGKVALDINI